MALRFSIALIALTATSTVSNPVTKAENTHLVTRDDKFEFLNSTNPGRVSITFNPKADYFDGSGYKFDDPVDSLPPCKRGLTVQCSVRQPDRDCYEGGDRRKQLPLRQLNQDQRRQVWDWAKYHGSTLKKEMSEASTKKISRLSESDRARRDLTAKTFYELPGGGEQKVDIGMAITYAREAFQSALSSIDEEQLGDFTFSFLIPKDTGESDFSTFPAVLGIGAHGPASTLYSTEPGEDRNYINHQVPTSALTWNAWRQMTSETDYKKLKYYLRGYIKNEETINIIKMIYEKYPDKLNFVDKNSLSGAKVAVGVWRPGDVGFDALLSTSNVKDPLMISLDHCDELDNPYITEIHTIAEYFKSQRYQENDADNTLIMPILILLKYGPAPPPEIPNVDDGTVMTSR